MFEDMVVSVQNQADEQALDRRAVHGCSRPSFLAILILIPLIYTEALPKTMMATMLHCSAAATATSASAASRAGRARQAASPLDGRGQTGAAESHSEGRQDY